jgi:hypothetical protein
MGLMRLKEEYLPQDGIVFWMEDAEAIPVRCRVSHEALYDLASNVGSSESDEATFEAYRDLIEEVASDLFDAGKADDRGRVLVTRTFC